MMFAVWCVGVCCRLLFVVCCVVCCLFMLVGVCLVCVVCWCRMKSSCIGCCSLACIVV